MATNNIKIFDENKGNIMSTQEYSTNAQRLNGVQQGIASSMLQNKTLYQVSLVAYAIGQMMVNNGLDANDDNAVSAFVGNLANTIVQKVVDKASTAEAQAGTDANKFMTSATTRAAINILKATSQMATAGTDDTHWMTPLLVKQMINSLSVSALSIQSWITLTADVKKGSSKSIIGSTNIPNGYIGYKDGVKGADYLIYTINLSSLASNEQIFSLWDYPTGGGAGAPTKTGNVIATLKLNNNQVYTQTYPYSNNSMNGIVSDFFNDSIYRVNFNYTALGRSLKKNDILTITFDCSQISKTSGSTDYYFSPSSPNFVFKELVFN